MSKVTCHQSISIDGFTAGPNQSLENPIGEGGMRLHQWLFDTAAFMRMQGLEGGSEGPDSDIVEELSSNPNVGAYIMGRNMFDAGRGEWDASWKGWWGENPPYHHPVFVLTHYARQPVPMQGGTTFHFVTDGVESALRQARDAAGQKDVQIAGGAETVRQFLRAGYLDELNLDLVPVVLGSGERLFQDVGEIKLTITRVIDSPAVTHLTYQVGRR
jgi:dihydrofolate reductase